MFPSFFWLLFLAVPQSQGSQQSGIELTMRRTDYGQTHEDKQYYLNDRKRMEFRGAAGQPRNDGSTMWTYGPEIAGITRCDLGQMFELNLEAREYTSAPYPPKPYTDEQMAAKKLTLPDFSSSAPRTIRIETTTVDTGERKDFFGHAARHVIRTGKTIPLEGSHSEPQETIVDGWYIDVHPEISCERRIPNGKLGHGYSFLQSGNQRPETPEFVDIGAPETGFAVQLVMTHTGSYRLADGTRKQFETTNEMLVTEFREGTLDPKLFEIPEGFTLVDHIARNPRMARSSTWLEEFWVRVKNFLN
jgi:hypothetical protein